MHAIESSHIAGMIGLGAAARYILKKGIAAIKKNELAVSRYAYTEISKIPGLTMYGPPKTHGVLAFAIAFVIIIKASPFSVRKEIEEDQNVALAIIVAAVILGIAIAYVVVRTKIPGRQLLDAMAMLPLAVPGLVMAFGYLWLTWREELGAPMLADEIDHALCFQPGCADPAVTEYQLKRRFSRDGHDIGPGEIGGSPMRRKFCARHARRGDCGLEDADSNYEVIGGPGPSGRLDSRRMSATLRSILCILELLLADRMWSRSRTGGDVP